MNLTTELIDENFHLFNVLKLVSDFYSNFAKNPQQDEKQYLLSSSLVHSDFVNKLQNLQNNRVEENPLFCCQDPTYDFRFALEDNSNTRVTIIVYLLLEESLYHKIKVTMHKATDLPLTSDSHQKYSAPMSHDDPWQITDISAYDDLEEGEKDSDFIWV